METKFFVDFHVIKKKIIAKIDPRKCYKNFTLFDFLAIVIIVWEQTLMIILRFPVSKFYMLRYLINVLNVCTN